MKIILSKQCESLTGSLGRQFGYVIVKRGNRFFSQRCNHKVPTPPCGHLLFILSSAYIAKSKLHINDICVSRDEMMDALWEAGQRDAADYIAANLKDFPTVFHVDDVINLKNKYNL